MRGHAISEFAKRGAERDMFRWPLVLKYLIVDFDDVCCTLHCKAMRFAFPKSHMGPAEDQAAHSTLHCKDTGLM